jgi:hypothetical protein
VIEDSASTTHQKTIDHHCYCCLFFSLLNHQYVNKQSEFTSVISTKETEKKEEEQIEHEPHPTPLSISFVTRIN